MRQASTAAAMVDDSPKPVNLTVFQAQASFLRHLRATPTRRSSEDIVGRINIA